jgi:hypothetical protein
MGMDVLNMRRPSRLRAESKRNGAENLEEGGAERLLT